MNAKSGGLDLSIVGTGDKRRLRVLAPFSLALRDFEGTADEATEGTILEGLLSPANAAAVRSHVPGSRQT